MPMQSWRLLWPGLAQQARVLAWNRFGLPGSQGPHRPLTGLRSLAALRELLAALELAPPYLLVGHSLGGLQAQLFARLYPRETAGVLLLEATHPEDRELLLRHPSQLLRGLARMSGQPQHALRPNLQGELACLGQTLRALAAAGPFPPVPLRVVTGGLAPPPALASPAAAGARRARQQQLARLAPGGRQVIAQRSGHFPQLTQPRLVSRVLRELLRQVRGRPGPPWQGP